MNMNTVARIAVVMFCIVGWLTDAHAGPWPRKAGKGIVHLGFSTIGYSKVYDDNGRKQPLPVDVRDNVLQLMGEVGLTDNITVSLALPLKFLSLRGSLARASNGLGDIDAAVRYCFMNANGMVLSGQALFGLPTGKTNVADGLRLGDGEFNTTLSVLAGRSFYPVSLYLSADAGFNIRTRSFSHDVVFNLEGGYGLLEGRLYLILLVSGRESLSNEPTLRPDASPAEMNATSLGLLGNNVEFLAIIPKIFFKVDPQWGITVSYATALHGRNVAGSVVLAGGVLFEF